MPCSASPSSASSAARSKGLRFGGALHLDEQPAAGLDDVHVHLGARVLLVGQVQHRRAGDDADAGGGQVVADRDALDRVGLTQLAQRQHHRHKGSGDCGGACAAVGLEHVAVEPHRPLAEVLEPHHRPQRPADQPLDLLRAAADLARGGFALRARAGGARQHAVFGRHPPLARAAQEGRHAIFHARRAHHARAAGFDQHRPFGVDVDAWSQLERAQLVGLSQVCSHLFSFRPARPALAVQSIRTCAPADAAGPHGRPACRLRGRRSGSARA